MAFSLAMVPVDLAMSAYVFGASLTVFSIVWYFFLEVDDACLNLIESVEYRSRIVFFRCRGEWRGFNESDKVRVNVYQTLHDLVLVYS